MEPVFTDKGVTLYQGDCLEVLKTLPDESVNCCVTSPPYFGLRDYGVSGQIGLEQTPDEYVAKMVAVFREVRRVLRDDGTLWLNLGDSYAANRGYQVPSTKGGPKHSESQAAGGKGSVVPDGLKPKDLIGIPWRVAFALQADGWYLRQDIIWHKPNPMPESVRDRCTKSHEYIFLLSKSPRYLFDNESIKEPIADRSRVGERTQVNYADKSKLGRDVIDRHIVVRKPTRNRRSVWTVATRPYKGAHFATFPPELIEPCILAGCPGSGKRCDCGEVIDSPTGDGAVDDPTFVTGRAGFNRPRREGEGRRPITRREQRHEAGEMKYSPHRGEIEVACGPAFAHYIRTDKSGARPLPEHLRQQFRKRGWITPATPCDCPVEPSGVVLDPFAGSGTTLATALSLGRRAVGIELNPDYCELIRQRVEKAKSDMGMFSTSMFNLV